jgi:hypothetical protein
MSGEPQGGIKARRSDAAKTIADGRRLAVYDTGSPNQRLDIDRLHGPKERERQRHSERDQCVDTACRFGLVELAATSGITCNDGVGGAPLENWVGAWRSFLEPGHHGTKILPRWPSILGCL